MATHISVRLFWHDGGWDGAICRDPMGNVYCEAHEHVREHKDPGEADDAVRGKFVAESGVHPGCEMSVQAFSRRRSEIRIWPPEWMTSSGVRPVDVKLDKHSSGMWPYENMWGEGGAHRSNDERRQVAEAFFEEVEEGKSLVFFYVDERNPLFVEDGERSPHRVLVGISRIDSYEKDIREWNEATFNDEVNMVWSVPFRHRFPKDGIRLPVQQILAKVPDPDKRAPYLVPLDGGIRADFRYGSSRVSLDRAVVVVERTITALSGLHADAVLEQSIEAELEWANAAMLELWSDRGPYPGLSPLLSALACDRPVEVANRAFLAAEEEGRDAAQFLFSMLEEGEVPDQLDDLATAIEDAADEWDYLDQDSKELARLLVRMELLPEQMKVIIGAGEARERHLLPTDAAELVANPYLLCERFVPERDADPISFITVDHGLLPHESMAALKEHRISRRDPRRLRALLTEALEAGAADGHTFVSAPVALAAVAAASPEDRVCDVPIERLKHEKVRPHLEGTIEQFEIAGEPYLALRSLHAHEQLIASVFDEQVAKPRLDAGTVPWQEIADQLESGVGGSPVSLSDEQVAALERSFCSPLSVITGAAGTGKSTLLAPLIAAVREREGHVPIRAMTPTGKAADRLKGVGVDAMTIHRALAAADWFDWKLGIWREGERRVPASTLIIDESSMVDVEMLGTLVAAIDWARVDRLILVGDHHQLPPIGPGRPFFDLIALMQDANDDGAEHRVYADRLSDLKHNYRVDEGSKAIAFANSFAGTAEPDEPQVWEAVAKGEDQGDLRVRYWDEADGLHRLLRDEVESLVEKSCHDAGLELDSREAFDVTLGHGEAPFGPSHWQILVPVKGSPHGARKLNALIQDFYHGYSKEADRWDGGAIKRWPVKFGDEQITSRDKVIQIKNQLLWVRIPGKKRQPGEKRPEAALFNGQIGLVRYAWPSPINQYRKKGDRGAVKKLEVEFDGMDDEFIQYQTKGKASVGENLELAYTVTVHKAQGSQFDHVMLVVPREAAELFGRELIYTGLTRAQKSLTLLIEKDIGALMSLRKRAAAKTPQRNSRLFHPTVGSLPYRAGRLVYGTTRGDRVASKSEVIIADLLHRYECEGQLTYEYERELYAPGGDPGDFRLPDFTIHVNGQTWFWEHCGMMDDSIYRTKWERVRLPWYKRYGFADRLIVTSDGPNDPIDSGRIEKEVVRPRLFPRRA